MINQSSIISWFTKIMNNHKSYDAKSIMYDYADLTRYRTLLFENDGIQEVTKKLIPLEQFNFNNSIKDVRKVLGRPSTTIKISLHPNIKIYLFKKIQNEYKVKFMFHYYNNQLVLVSRIKPYCPDNQILDDQNKLLKHFNLPLIKKKKRKISLKDTDGNMLVSTKNIQYFEYYIKNEKSFRDFILKQKNQPHPIS